MTKPLISFRTRALSLSGDGYYTPFEWPENSRPAEGEIEEWYFGQRIIDRRWGDLTRREKIKESTLILTRLVASVALLGGLQWIAGQPGREISDAEFRTAARDQITREFAGLTALKQFETMYISGETSEVNIDNGGSGLLRHEHQRDYVYGQDCLASTGYNTNPSEIRGRAEGNISPVASLSSTGDGGIAIYPAGSSTPPLKFTVADNGLLKATSNTYQTLKQNGCNPDVLPVWTYGDTYGDEHALGYKIDYIGNIE